MTKSECYEILGLKPPSSIQEVKRAYRKLIKKYHPDSNNSSNVYLNQYLRVQIAYKTIVAQYSRYNDVEFDDSFDYNMVYYPEPQKIGDDFEVVIVLEGNVKSLSKIVIGEIIEVRNYKVYYNEFGLTEISLPYKLLSKKSLLIPSFKIELEDQTIIYTKSFFLNTKRPKFDKHFKKKGLSIEKIVYIILISVVILLAKTILRGA